MARRKSDDFWNEQAQQEIQSRPSRLKNADFWESQIAPEDYAAESAPEPVTPERTSRTWGEAAGDATLGVVKGAFSGARSIVDFGSAVLSGGQDDPNSGWLDEFANYTDAQLQAAKSGVIKAKEKRLDSLISNPDVPISEALSYFGKNISDLGAQVAIESLGAMAVGAGVTGAAAKVNAIRSMLMQGGLKAAAIGGAGESMQIAGDVYRNTGGDMSAMGQGLGMGILTSALTPGNIGSAIGKKLATREAARLGETVVEDGIESVARKNALSRFMAEDSLTAGAARTARTTVAEGAQEFVQEGGQSVIEQSAGGDVEWNQVLKKGGIGAIVGGIMGGGTHLTPLGEGGVATREEIESVRTAQQALAAAQQALATNPGDPTLQSGVDSARANLSARSMTPEQRQVAADAAIATTIQEILTAPSADAAVQSLERGMETGSDLRTGATAVDSVTSTAGELTSAISSAARTAAEADVLRAGRAARAAGVSLDEVAAVTDVTRLNSDELNAIATEHSIPEMRALATAAIQRLDTMQTAAGSYSPDTVEAVPAAPTVAPAPAAPTVAPAPAAPTNSFTNAQEVINATHGNALVPVKVREAIQQVAMHAIDHDSTLNIASIVERMSENSSTGPVIRRPASVPEATWDTFVQHAQQQTGAMVPRLNSHGRTVRANLEDIAANGSRPGRLLAERLLATNNPAFDMLVQQFEPAQLRANTSTRGMVQSDPNTGAVTEFRMNQNIGTESSFLHESLHAATLRWLHGASTTDPLYRELLDLTNKVRDAANAKGITPYGTHPGAVTEDRVRMAEFLAEAFTRGSFQQFLRTIPVTSNRTAWDSFREWVAKLTGITSARGDTTALELALNINDDVMSRSARIEREARAPAAEPLPTINPDLVAEPEPTAQTPQAQAPAVTVYPDALASARQTWLNQSGNDPSRADAIESMDRAALEGVVRDTRRPRLQTFVRAILDHAAAGHPTRMTEQPAGSPEVVAAITRMRELGRQNGDTAMRVEDSISAAREDVANLPQAELDRDIAALENANQNSLADLYRALMAERPQAITPAQSETARLRQAAIDEHISNGISRIFAEDVVAEMDGYSDSELNYMAATMSPGTDPISDYARHLQSLRTMSPPPNAVPVTSAQRVLDEARAAVVAIGLLPVAIEAMEQQTFGQHVAAYSNLGSDPEIREFRFALAEAEAARTGAMMLMTWGEFSAREQELVDVTLQFASINRGVADRLSETLNGYSPVELNNLANGLTLSGRETIASYQLEQVAAARVGIAFAQALPMDLVDTVITRVTATPPPPPPALTPAQRAGRTRVRNALRSAIGDRVRYAGGDMQMQEGLFYTLNGGRPLGVRTRMSPVQRAYLSMINQVGVDEAREYAINQQHRTLQAQGLPSPQVLTDWRTARTGGAPAPAPAPAPVRAAAGPTRSELVQDLEDARGGLYGPATHNGVLMTPEHIDTLNELELEVALQTATRAFQNRTARMLRARLNLLAFDAGRPPPHPRRATPTPQVRNTTSSSGGLRPPAADGQDQTSLPNTAVDAPAMPPPSLTAEQDFTRRLASAKQSGALVALAEFWTRITSQPGQRLFAQDEIPVDDLRVLARQNGGTLNQAILTTLKDRYNEAFRRHAVEWAQRHNEPIPPNEPIITSLSTQAGHHAQIELYGRGRGRGNPFVRQGSRGDSSIGVTSTTTGIRSSPGASDICYRIVADMMYINGETSHNSNGLCTNNNVRRQWQSFAQGARLGNPDLIHPIGHGIYSRGQGMPETYRALSEIERIGANALRVAHNAWYPRVMGNLTNYPKGRALSNLVLNADGETYTALYDPVDTRGFPRGTVVTKVELKAKVGELLSFDASGAGGYGPSTLTFSMLTDQFLEAFENNVSPIALETMAVNYGRDAGGWFMSQDGGVDPITQSVLDLMDELREPSTSNQRKAEINAEIRSLQEQRSRNAQETNSVQQLNMQNVDRMVAEMGVAADIGARFAAAGGGRATVLNSQDGTVTSDPEVANSPEGQAAIIAEQVSPGSRAEMEIAPRMGHGWFEERSERLRELYQNKDVTLGRILQTLGKTKPLELLDTFAGKAESSLKELVLKPFAAIDTLLTAAKISRASFEEYLKMRHAEEYNQQTMKINPLQLDANGAYLRGHDMENHPGSGIKTSEARAYMAGEHKGAMIGAARLYDAMNKGLRKFAVETGLESADTIAAWEAMFPNYTPFRRSLDIEDLGANGVGGGFSVREGISRRAMGSSAEILSPLAATLQNASNIITRGHKALVGQSMLAVAMNGPIPMYRTAGDQLKPMWKVNTMPNIRTVKRVRVYQIQDSNNTLQRNANGVPVEFYNANEARTYARLNSNNTTPLTVKDQGAQERVVSAHNPAYINKDNVLIIPVNGENKVLVFDEGSQDAMAMVRNLKNLDTAQVDGFFKIANQFSRFTVATSTGLNPMFAPINFIRDILSSAINIMSAKVPGWKASDSAMLMAKAGGNIKGLLTYFQSEHKAKHSNETPAQKAKREAKNAADPRIAMLRRAERAGGLTGVNQSFSNYEDALRSTEHLFGDPITENTDPRINQHALRRVGNAIEGVVDAAGRFVEGSVSDKHKTAKALSNIPVAITNLNNAFEAATRLAAFEIAFNKFKASGMSEAEAEAAAAIVSKNVSVNFNRRGQLSSRMNALFPFFNAAAQGSARLAELMFEKVQVKNKDGAYEQKTKLTKVGLKVALALPALGVFQAFLLTAAGYEDDQPPEWVKSRNFIIPIGNKEYRSIPLPLGLNALFNMGREGTDMFLHPENMGKHLVNVALEPLSAFNPLGATPNALLQATPAIADIPVALLMNKDFANRPIYKTDRDPRHPTPGFTRNKEGTSDAAIAIAEMLSKATGGNEYRPGAIDITGNQVEYFAGQIGGGITREALKAGQFAFGSETSEDRPWYKVPLLGKFAGSVGDSNAVREQLYTKSADLNVLNAEYKGLKEDKKFAEAAAFRREHPELDYQDDMERYFKAESKLRKERKSLAREGLGEEVAKLNAASRAKGEKLLAEIDKAKQRATLH